MLSAQSILTDNRLEAAREVCKILIVGEHWSCVCKKPYLRKETGIFAPFLIAIILQPWYGTVLIIWFSSMSDGD